MTTKTNKRTRKEAKKLMWEYYRDNKASLPKWIRDYREIVIDGLLTGSSVEKSFEEALAENRLLLTE